MPDADLLPADSADLAQALAYALRFRRGSRTRSADETMAQITAERLVEHLEEAGFVVLRKPPAAGGANLASAVRENR